MHGSTRSRNRVLEKAQVSDRPLKTSEEDAKHKGTHQTLFSREKRVSSCSAVLFNLEENGKKVSFERESDAAVEKAEKKKSSVVIRLPVKSEKLISEGTQTDYRESETQTLPWKHEIKAERKILEELLLLDWFDQEKNFPPGMEEVLLTEKARERLAWENIIERLRGKENETLRKSLVLKLATSETAFREEEKEEEKRERLALSRRLMKEEKEAFEKKLRLRLQRSYDCHKKEKECQMDSWNHQMKRKIRKMGSVLKQPTKTDIITMHQDKTSLLYAPKRRDGDNPSLRHEVIDIQCRYLKRFHGLEFLETRISHILEPQVFKFSFETGSSKPEKIKLCLRKFGGQKEKSKSSSLKVSVPAPTPELSSPNAAKTCSN